MGWRVCLRVHCELFLGRVEAHALADKPGQLPALEPISHTVGRVRLPRGLLGPASGGLASLLGRLAEADKKVLDRDPAGEQGRAAE